MDLPDHDIPLDLLLEDAAAALGAGGLHGLSRACLIANAILTGMPSSESFIADIIEALDAASDHARYDHAESRVALQAAIDKVETWGLDPERRTRSALREIVATLETIRQISATGYDGTTTINALAERGLGVLGIPPHQEDESDDDARDRV